VDDGRDHLVPPKTAGGEDGRDHLILGRELFAQGEFESAFYEHQRAISVAGRGPVAEEALLYMGLICAHPANPKRDYARSAAYFKELAKGDPTSPFVEQANVLISILQSNERLYRTVQRLTATIDTMKKADTDKAKTVQQKEELNRTIERLNAMIEALKKVDIGIEDKKRAKAR
jgi:hypothetical protein